MGNFFPVPRLGRRTYLRRSLGTRFARVRKAHTLVELVVAVAIVVILASLGWGSMNRGRTRYNMMQAARLLQSDVGYLRAYAVATGKQTRLHFLAADTAMDPQEAQIGEWNLQIGNRATASTEWDTLPEDRDATPNSNEGERSISKDGANEAPWISLAPWPTLEGSGTGNEDCVVFSPRGWLENPAGDFVDGYLRLEFVNKFGLSEGVDEAVNVTLSRGGLARIESSSSTSLPSGAVGTATTTSE